MKQFSKLMLIALSFGIVTLALSVVPSKPVGAAGSAPVTVTNTPLPIQGTANAAQSGTWNVGINGTPNVNIANAPNVNIGSLPAVQLASGTTVGISGTPSVNINNSGASPLFVQDSGSGFPFVQPAAVQIAAGQSQGHVEFMSPHGAVTVIESVSGFLLPPPDLPPGVTFGVSINLPQGGSTLLFPGQPLPSPGPPTYSFHERMQIYIDQDRPIGLFVQGTGPFSFAQSAGMTLTGRILPCPLPSTLPSGSLCATSRLIQP